MQASSPDVPALESPRAQRRPRPRGSLSRELIVGVALEILERDGESALTMRRIADALGTGAMSLYRHVRDKDDLIDGITRLALSELATTPPRGNTWSEQVSAWMIEMRAQLRAHQAVVPLLRANGEVLPALLAPAEILLKILLDAGMPRSVAARAAWEVLWFTMGFVVAELRANAGERPLGRTTFSVADARREEMPELARALPDLMQLGADDVFASGARHLVDGMRRELEQTR